MDRNSRKQDINGDRRIDEMRRIPNWGQYGVQRFPFRGRYRYTPSTFQSSDGGTIISNDVFGMTIKQFDCQYKACLERRKTQEQRILNLRYPDKSTNEYLEYLQYCTNHNTNELLWSDADLKEKSLFEHLVHTVGTEWDIRNRQRLFKIHDMILNVAVPYTIQISSGSLAEGLNLPGSDQDIMYVITEVDVRQNLKDMKHPIQRSILIMETDTDYPGFVKLRLGAVGVVKSELSLECFEKTSNGLYLSIKGFFNAYLKGVGSTMILHGPCLSDKDNTLDVAACLHMQCLPYNTVNWRYRHRHQWPPNVLINKIVHEGCLVVPIGPKLLNSNLFWRISFSLAEKLLVHSFNFTQILCYSLLKLTLKHIINTDTDLKELLCSYFLKTVLFWVSEEVDIDTFQLSKLFHCFSICIDKLKSWINNCYCPNYFIPEHNMFLGRIDQRNKRRLLNILGYIKLNGIHGLIQKLFSLDDCNLTSFGTQSDKLGIELDFLFYRVLDMRMDVRCIDSCYRAVSFIENLLKCESSTFIIGVCKYYYAKISQEIAHLLTKTTATHENYNLCKRYHRHLQDGTKTDSASGWLLYASFCYVIRQYNVALKLIDYVLSKCTPDLLPAGQSNYVGNINNDTYNLFSKINFHDKMKLATVHNVVFLTNSSILPKELQFIGDHCIPPVVFAHCLRFLCYHHLCDNINRQQALRDLQSTVQYRYFIQERLLQDSLKVLGICFQISGDTHSAYQCYKDAFS